MKVIIFFIREKENHFVEKLENLKKFLPLQAIKTNQHLSLLKQKMTPEEKEAFNNYGVCKCEK